LDIKTHNKVSEILVGKPLEVVTGIEAMVELEAIADMTVDSTGLVHGGFTFGLADYAAMLAVNQPYVVLSSAQTKFTAPVRVGDKMRAKAKVIKTEGKRSEVNVDVMVGKDKVFTGTFLCYSLEKHVLEKSD